MSGQNHSVASPCRKIHGSTHSVDLLTRNHPVSQVSLLAHLERAKNGPIQVTAANHSKRGGRIKGGPTRIQRYGLFAGVDQVVIHLLIGGIRPHTENAVLRMETNSTLGFQVIGHQSRDTDTQVDIAVVR